MTIHSRPSDPSDKGKNIIELSDDEDNELLFTDPDSSQSSCEEVVQANKKNKTDPTLLWEIWEEETKNWLDQHLTEDIDLDNVNEVNEETVVQSPDLIIPLLRYQKEEKLANIATFANLLVIHWGLKQEESPLKGGILADEMGMGKIVQAIALVLSKRALSRSQPVDQSTNVKVKATLVICPLIAVMQWVNKIDRFTTKGSNKVLVYHGANREKTLAEFSEYDFIITTYSNVEDDYRNYVTPPKERCEWCEEFVFKKNLESHIRYVCGPDRVVKSTKHVNHYEKDGIFGVLLSVVRDDLDEREYNKEAESNENTECTLHSVKWDRVILGEAHYIKDRRSNTTRAVLALESTYKWALSGTPLQNNIGELYSLVRFLQITPYSYYLCKECDCKVLTYIPNSSCTNCPHKLARHFSWWNKHIAKPITKRVDSDYGKRAMILLKNKILKSILIRRTKKGRAADLALLPRTITLRRDHLNVTDQNFYLALYRISRTQFNRFVKEGTLMNNYAHIFDLLMQLRMAVNHPYLVEYLKSAVESRANEAKSNDEQVCDLCDDVAEDHVVTSCEHLFCKSCLIQYCECYGQPSCPSCSKQITVDFSQNKDQEHQFKPTSIINRIPLDNFQTSTKIDALLEEIGFMVERDGSAKGIVFSQFTSFLDLIKYSLDKSGVKCVQFDGSMTMSAREAVITRFTEDEKCKVFLMSLKEGGVALNLSVASHVFFMDPWWNPAVEQLAQDRIHRVGQYKPIRVVRFVIENTIEEKILNLQEKKESVFKGTSGGSNEALGKLTVDDFRLLFA